MSEASERTLLLLQELAVMKQAEQKKGKPKRVERPKRRQEICDEIKQIAADKEQSTEYKLNRF